MICDFMSSFPKLSDFVIVRVFVRNEECAGDGASVWVPTFASEEGVVVDHVVRVDGIVEGQKHNLVRELSV